MPKEVEELYINFMLDKDKNDQKCREACLEFSLQMNPFEMFQNLSKQRKIIIVATHATDIEQIFLHSIKISEEQIIS